ncbi:MAG: TonB-dependent receptor [Bacteroidia bacterium]
MKLLFTLLFVSSFTFSSLYAQEMKQVDLQDVIILGNRGSIRTKVNSPVPVDVIDVKKIQSATPLNNLNDLLNYLVPSFNANRQSASDGTEHIDPASLRGLGPDQVLVLVNGKRRHTTSLVNYQNTVGNGSVGTDLSAIPVAAVDRIEVLRDGASAQYGSDAIAGVINIILKKDFGLSSSVTYGQTSKNDGQTVGVDLNYGAKLGSNGFINLTGLFNNREKTNRSQNHNLIIFDQSALNNYFSYDFTDNPEASRAFDDAQIAAKGLNRNDFNFQIGDAKIRNVQLFLNSEFSLGSKVQAYIFGGSSFRNGVGFGFRRLPSELTSEAIAVYPNGFQPELQSNIVDHSISAGLKFAVSKWNVDLSNTFGYNQFDYRVEKSFNYALGDRSPTSFNAGYHSFAQNTLDASADRKFDLLAGLNVALGAEFRSEKYQIGNGDGSAFYGSGSESFPGFGLSNNVNESRSNTAAYLQGDLDITKKIYLGAAVRTENYSDFGSTFNYKLAARWEVIDHLAVRAAFSTGFRAPSLQQSYFNNIATDVVDGVLLNSGIFRNNSEVAKAIGIQKLKQETSKNISAGVTWSPLNDLSFSVDAYQIQIDNRVILTGNLGNDSYGNPVDEIRAFFKPFGTQTGRFFTNAINTGTNGIDAVSNYKWRLKVGVIDISLAYNYSKTKIERNADGTIKYNAFPAFLTKFPDQKDVFFGPQEQSLIETNNPVQKGALRLNYSNKKWNVLLANTYFGEVTRNGFPFGIEQKHSPKVVTDLSVGYNLLSNLRLTVGANNLLDVYPDLQKYENSYFGVFKYAPVQMGTTGAFYFARLNFTI